MKRLVLIAAAALAIAACTAKQPTKPQPVEETPPEPAPVAAFEVKIERHSSKVATVRDLLPEGHTIGTEARVGGIRVLAVNQPGAPADTEYLTLQEAMAANLCTVSEHDGVSSLQITNRADKPLFLMVGDLLLGGKQDRILAESVVIEAGAKDTPIPAFCVEQGRWHTEAGNDASAREEFYMRADSAQVDFATKRAAIGTASQGAVWAAVSSNNANLGVGHHTRTGSFRATFDDEKTKKQLQDRLDEVRAITGAETVGYMVEHNGKVVAMDLFDSSGLLRKLSDQLLRSYLVTDMAGAYTSGEPHPLAERLQDRVTFTCSDTPLSVVVTTLADAWTVPIKVEDGDLAATPMQLAFESATVADVLHAICEAAGCRVSLKDDRVLIQVLEREAFITDNQTPDSFRQRAYTNTMSGSNGPALESPRNEAPVAQNDATTTARNYETNGVDYTCTDTKRNSPVHRSFMGR
jgi:hypothetical protein